MMKKILSVILSVIITALMCVSAFAGSVTSGHTPSERTASLKWSVKFGDNYRTAPSVPAVAENCIFVMSGKKLNKLSPVDGSVISSGDMSASCGFGYIAPLYANGVVYCPLNGSVIEAFDAKTMEKLWSYKDVTDGQSQTPIVYSDGFIYTGFWYDEDVNGNFVCLDALTGELIWSFAHIGGFYWSGCCISGDYCIFGGDDGTVYDDRPSELYCLDKRTGEVSDSIDIIGDQRSGVVYDDNSDSYFFVTKAGYLYSLKLENGRFRDLMSLDLGGAATASPNVYGGRVYVGIQKSGFGKGALAVIDSETLTLVYEAETDGYPQSEVLVSSFYGDTAYVYFTCNSASGGLYLLKDEPGNKDVEVVCIFTPSADQSGFSVSTVCSDANGTLYYKNDSCRVFAIETDDGHYLEDLIKALISFLNRISDMLKMIFK